MTDDRIDDVVDTAAVLVAAVRRRDTAAVAQVLDGDIDWPALAVLLADNIGCVHDPRLMHPTDRTHRERTCPGCGHRGRRTVDRCKECADALIGGAWVPNGNGTLDWHPNPPPARGGRPNRRHTLIENAAWLAESGDNLTSVCARLGVTAEYLWTACRREGRPDVYARLADRETDGALRRNMRHLKAAARPSTYHHESEAS